MRMIVFDLDGTLVDSAPEIIGAMEKAWLEVELGSFPRGRFRIGPPLMELVSDLGATKPDALAAAFRRHYDASDFSASPPFVGMLDVLDAIRAANGEAAIATNKRFAPTHKIVERWFGGRFAHIACSDAFDGAPGKYTKAEMVKLVGGDVLVGDTVADVEAAREAGVRAVAITWGYDSAAALEKAEPDALVRDPSALFSALYPAA